MALSIRENFLGGVIKRADFAGLHLVDGIYPARTKVPSHSHQQAIFCIALTGRCDEVYVGKNRQYEALTVEFLPPDQSHSLDFPFDTRAFSLDVETHWLERAREYSLNFEDSIHSHGGSLSRLMMKLYNEFLQRDEASPLAIEGLALEMLAEASRRQVKISGRRHPKWLSQTTERLRDGYSGKLTITQLAAAVGVHPVHLAREFRRFHHCTIGDYIRRLRIEQACRELRVSHQSLAAIASDAGFSDQSHFSRTFKRHVGMTPARYRATFGTN